MKNGIHTISLMVLIITRALVASVPALPQQGRWASDTDPAAKYMIDMERQRAESGCTHQPVAEKALADDFQGTAPSGERYDKAEAIQRESSLNERECRLDEPKVRFFGDSVALVYGSEHAVVKVQGGAERERCLVWTDTWLNRTGKWQIVAAQDTALPCK